MSYDIHLDVKFAPLVRFDVAAEAALHQPWFNQTLTQVDDAVVRLGVLEGPLRFAVIEAQTSRRLRRFACAAVKVPYIPRGTVRIDTPR